MDMKKLCREWRLLHNTKTISNVYKENLFMLNTFTFKLQDTCTCVYSIVKLERKFVLLNFIENISHTNQNTRLMNKQLILNYLTIHQNKILNSLKSVLITHHNN